MRDRRFLLLALAVVLLAPAALTVGLPVAASETTVILIRHAEKEAEPTRDPTLSETGQARARELAHVLGRADVAAIFATQFQRTQQTVQPLAERLGLELTVTPVEDVDRSSAELAERILSRFHGKVVVVAGHSNTVPRIIEALGAGPAPEIADDQYDGLFVVTVGPDGAQVLHLRYGERSP